MEKKAVRIQLAGRITFEDDLSISEATQVIALVDSFKGALAKAFSGNPPTPLPASAGQHGAVVQTPRDSLEISGARTNPEKIVAFARFILDKNGLDTFKPDDIRPMFRQAREATPKNFNRDLSDAVRFGWIAETDTPSVYHLTAKVDSVFDGLFNAIRSRSASNGTRPRKSVKKSKAVVKPDVFANVDEFPETLAGLTPYSQIKTNTDKVLWAIAYAREVGIKEVTAGELSWLTDQLGHGFSTSHVTTYFNGLEKKNFANRSVGSGKFRITQSGTAYLSTLTVDGTRTPDAG